MNVSLVGCNWAWGLGSSNDCINSWNVQSCWTIRLLWMGWDQSFIFRLNRLIFRWLLLYNDLPYPSWLSSLGPLLCTSNNNNLSLPLSTICTTNWHHPFRWLAIVISKLDGIGDFLGCVIQVVVVVNVFMGFQVLLRGDRHLRHFYTERRTVLIDVIIWRFRLSYMQDIRSVIDLWWFRNSKPHIRLFHPRIHKAPAVHFSRWLLVSRISHIMTALLVISGPHWRRPYKSI